MEQSLFKTTFVTVNRKEDLAYVASLQFKNNVLLLLIEIYITLLDMDLANSKTTFVTVNLQNVPPVLL